jgi:hypothetical protein
MIKITDEMLERAAKNAHHVRIRVIDLRGLLFTAQSSTDPTVIYRVRLRRTANGERWASCECPSRAGYCRHIAAAVIYVLAIKDSRKRAAKLAASRAEEAVSSGGAEKPNPHRCDESTEAPKRTLAEDIAASVLIKAQPVSVTIDGHSI